jgi:hypothetical protein
MSKIIFYLNKKYKEEKINRFLFYKKDRNFVALVAARADMQTVYGKKK